jgi:hypothetical protein
MKKDFGFSAFWSQGRIKNVKNPGIEPATHGEALHRIPVVMGDPPSQPRESFASAGIDEIEQDWIARSSSHVLV